MAGPGMAPSPRACVYVPRAAHDDGVLAVLRSRLGDTAFAEAWAWGSSVSGRDAVDYALETG